MYDLERCKKECEKIANAKGYPIDVPIVLGKSNNLIATVKYKYDWDNQKCIVSKITFYPLFFDQTDEECHDTIIHEMAHYLDFKRSGRDHAHGEEFRKIVHELGGTKETCRSVRHLKEKDEG